MGAFYFFTSKGHYTGEHALSLIEFAEKVRSISWKSLAFHFYRGDFENWFHFLGCAELADEFRKLRSFNLNLQGETLRVHISTIVQLHRTLTIIQPALVDQDDELNTEKQALDTLAIEERLVRRIRQKRKARLRTRGPYRQTKIAQIAQ